MPVEKNKEYIVEIIDNGYEGEGIAKIEGFTIFIPNSIKGEKVKILIVKVLKSHAFGKIIEILEKSPNRVETDCTTYKRCGGCDLRHIKYEETLKMKQNAVQSLVNKTLKTKIEVQNTLGMEKPYNYRNKAQYPVGMDKEGKPVIGVFANRTHEIIPIKECLIQNKKSQELAKFILNFIMENKISIYDEKTLKGLIRHIVTKIGIRTNEIMCIIVINGKTIPKEKELVSEIIERFPEVKTIVKNINPATLIIDFNPILKRNYLKDINCPVYEIDGHNIIPAKYVSQKQEYNAATLRRKIYHNIYPFLTEFNNETIEKVEADYVLDDFIKNKLPYYAELKNDPSKNIISGLSKYLNLGFISSQRVALEIIKSNTAQENKESFLEELVIRKELSDNFCLYAENFKNFSGIPTWAKTSLNNHKFDLRTYTYSLKEFEEAKTHDKLWNAAQNQLRKEGSIHAYLRMYWAKKILEWTNSPSNALNTAIYLNDKYAYDSPSSNGYTGILWTIGGLHDRAFINYPITGKIRRMTYDSMKKKYNLTEYIKKYLPE